MYKVLILLLFLVGCSSEIYDYEIKKGYEVCNGNLYSIEIITYQLLRVNCSNGKPVGINRERK